MDGITSQIHPPYELLDHVISNARYAIHHHLKTTGYYSLMFCM